MKVGRTPPIMILALLLPAAPARACVSDAPLVLEDVRFADAVVVGRIANYEMVLDPRMRRERREMEARLQETRARRPDLPEQPARFLTDYARFNVVIDEVLSGGVAGTITVTWDNSTFNEPESMPPGSFVIALRNARSDMPPLRGLSATITANREPDSLTVLQAPCSVPFMFESDSEEARTVRRLLEQGAGATRP